MSESPRIVGRYALYDEIASGGMATVFLARLLGAAGFSRIVAVKKLHPQYAADPDFLAMFLDEARLSARIRHPNVVTTLDVVAEGGELLIVMEYAQGESLSRLLKAVMARDALVPPAVAVAMISGVLHGLHAAHEAKDERGEPLGIVHRDVSPQNIVVGVDGIARVLDFGIAKASGRLYATREGSLKGKLSYMAPEQLRSGEITRRTDVFAASVVLWETLTARRLFLADHEGAIVEKVLHEAIVPPSSVVPGLPSALDRVLLRGLEREPGARFATAHEMAVGLEACVQGTTPASVGGWVRMMARAALDTRASQVARIEAAASGSNHAAVAALAQLGPPGSETLVAPAAATASPPPAQQPVRGYDAPVAGTMPSIPDKLVEARKRRRWPWAAGATAVAAAALLAVRGANVGAPAPSGVVSSRGTPSTVSPPEATATAITALPPPATKSEDARVAYVAGLQAMRDDNWDRAETNLAHAVELDPGLAAAHLRLALMSWGQADSTAGRERFARAAGLRAQLSPRDALFMSAVEPLLRTPSDLREASTRLEQATIRYPLDVELLDWLAIVRAGDAEASLAAASRAVALDPEDGTALESKGRALALLGQSVEADAAFERCSAVSLETTDCLWWKLYADNAEGRCAEVERGARRILERAPRLSTSYVALAGALLAEGRPRDLVGETVSQATALVADPRRNYAPTWLSLAEGDFTRARTMALESLAKMGSDPLYNPHYFASLALVTASLESGDKAGAYKAAAEFAARREAWAEAQGPTQGVDKSLWLMRLAREGGALSAAELAARRKEWVDRRVGASHAFRGLVWTYAYAATAETPAEAEEALAALPDFLPLTSYAIGWVGLPDAEIGHVRLVAGRVDEALSSLRKAVDNCNVLIWPFEHVRAALELGQALEQSGDSGGACAAYQRVIDAWGSARPRSVSADKARTRIKALSCPRR